MATNDRGEYRELLESLPADEHKAILLTMTEYADHPDGGNYHARLRMVLYELGFLAPDCPDDELG